MNTDSPDESIPDNIVIGRQTVSDMKARLQAAEAERDVLIRERDRAQERMEEMKAEAHERFKISIYHQDRADAAEKRVRELMDGIGANRAVNQSGSGTPTDQQLNEAMARALDWRSDGTWNGRGIPSEQNWYHPKRPRTAPSPMPPNFCHDRNELLAVWKEVGNCLVIPEFMRLLGLREGAFRAWDILVAEPRLHVIAALKAIQRWPAEWDSHR